MVRVRFAPSPTGYLHVGGARTALFNWLFARRHGGAFVLRIEDTDAERSSWEMVAGIVDGLRWLGLDWDEGPDVGGPHAPYFQSERLDKYRARATRLVEEGHAYYCYCDPEVLKQRRDKAQARGEVWQYDRACLRLSPERVAELEATGAPRAIRFKVPVGSTRFDDLVHGPIEFGHDNIEDFVVLRSDLHPTYHLSVVVDDIDMGITHVIRGDDHISNTPKQVLLYDAFGRPAPKVAHVPLILGPDKKRLSKRHGATSVTEYRNAGYLPEAMVNFLALLGWSPGRRGTGAPGCGEDREVFTRDELVAAFSLEAISSGHAVFNPDKLDWFNAQHIARMPAEKVARRIEPDLRAAGLWRDELAGPRRAWLHAVIELVKPRVKKLANFAGLLQPFLGDTIEPDPDAVAKHLNTPDLGSHLAALRDRLATVDPFEAGAVEAALRQVAAERGVKAASLIHAMRVAVTGQTVGPGLFEVLALVGRDRVVARLAAAERRTLSSPT
jgi:glutamyl-tRNA synthetase